jgi:hypothetical protein
MSGDYKVGKGKPPEGTMFRPGQSGNPAGRPRKHAQTHERNGDISPFLLDELNREVTVTEAGVSRTMTTEQLVVRQLVTTAARGNRLAGTTVLGLRSEAARYNREERAEVYKFWQAYRRSRWNSPPNWPRVDGCPALFPHPDDVIIDPTHVNVRFVGPMDVEEQYLFMLPLFLRDIFLIDAEICCRGRTRQPDLMQSHLWKAQLMQKLLVPSLGGARPGEPTDACLHRLVCRQVELGLGTLADLRKRRSHAVGQFDQCLQTLGWPSTSLTAHSPARALGKLVKATRGSVRRPKS